MPGRRALYWTQVLLLASLSPAALAQTAGQITPRSFRPDVQGSPGAIAIPEARGIEAPEGADRLTVRVGGVSVEGGLPGMAAQTSAITDPLAGRTVTAAEIFAAARALEQAYARAGYVLSRVVLPAQNLSDGGTLRLIVIDGQLERIDTTQLPRAIRERVAMTLAPLVGQRGLTMGQIERRLLLAGDMPGTALRSTLTPGDSQGGGVLVVEARHQPITGFLSVDNTLPETLGRWTTGFGLDANSVLGFGETFYLRGSGYLTDGTHGIFAGQPRNRALAGGVIIPLGTDGLTLNLEATDARTTPFVNPRQLAFTSDFTRYSLRLRYPVIRKREATFNVEGAFDAQEEQLSAIAPVIGPISHDVLRIFRLSGDGFATLPWGGGLISGRATLSLGVNGLGARSAPDPGGVPLSRQGARPDFQKAEISLRYDQPIRDHLSLTLFGRAQTAFGQALPRAEQIGLSTPTGLSAFAAGIFQGDGGYVTRAELQAPFSEGLGSWRLTGGAAPYVFGAMGEVSLNDPTALERRHVRGTAYGVGVRFGAAREASFSNLGFTLEWGRQDRSDQIRTDDRITFSTLLRF